MAAPSLHAPSAHRTPDERLAEGVSRLARGWMRLGREGARNLGLSAPQLFLLNGLREMGSVPVLRWVDEMGASPSAMTGLLDGLESAGFVSRSHGVEDRRQVLVSLTPSGRRLADRLQSEFRVRWKQYCEGIPGRDLDRVSETLERITSRMASPSAVPPLLHPTRTRSRRTV